MIGHWRGFIQDQFIGLGRRRRARCRVGGALLDDWGRLKGRAHKFVRLPVFFLTLARAVVGRFAPSASEAAGGPGAGDVFPADAVDDVGPFLALLGDPHYGAVALRRACRLAECGLSGKFDETESVGEAGVCSLPADDAERALAGESFAPVAAFFTEVVCSPVPRRYPEFDRRLLVARVALGHYGVGLPAFGVDLFVPLAGLPLHDAGRAEEHRLGVLVQGSGPRFDPALTPPLFLLGAYRGFDAPRALR